MQPACAPSNESVMELLVMMDAVKRSSARRMTARIPYYGYARTRIAGHARRGWRSRTNWSRDMIQIAGAHRVLTMILRADQIPDSSTSGWTNIDVAGAAGRYLAVGIRHEGGVAGRGQRWSVPGPPSTSMPTWRLSTSAGRTAGTRSQGHAITSAGKRPHRRLIDDLTVDTSRHVVRSGGGVEHGARKVLAYCTHRCCRDRRSTHQSQAQRTGGDRHHPAQARGQELQAHPPGERGADSGRVHAAPGRGRFGQHALLWRAVFAPRRKDARVKKSPSWSRERGGVNQRWRVTMSAKFRPTAEPRTVQGRVRAAAFAIPAVFPPFCTVQASRR